MAWLEIHQSLLNHRKTLELAELLDLPPLYAASHVIALWLWALDNAPNGDCHVRVTILSRAAQWDGDANMFVASLIEAGFLDQQDDGGITIHDWHDYAGKLLDARRRHAEIVRNSRRNKRETPPQQSDDGVTVTLPSRDQSTVQYSTVHNSTEQDINSSPPANAARGKRQPKQKTSDTPQFDYRLLWHEIEGRFDRKLTWSFPAETKAVKAIIGAYGDVTVDDLVAFLAYKATCYGVDPASQPTFSRYKGDFAAWYTGGKPTRQERNNGTNLTNRSNGYRTKAEQLEDAIAGNIRVAKMLAGAEGGF